MSSWHDKRKCQIVSFFYDFMLQNPDCEPSLQGFERTQGSKNGREWQVCRDCLRFFTFVEQKSKTCATDADVHHARGLVSDSMVKLDSALKKMYK